MAVSAYFYLGIWIMSLIQLFASQSSKPNIIMIVADDLGWNDVSFHGSSEIPTPNIDKLAKSGIILDNYYVLPICSPTRSAIMTGRYPINTGMQSSVILSPNAWGVGLNETFLPQYLKSEGYVNHGIGKWHLGFYAKELTPTYRGFDSFYGYYCGKSDYWDHSDEEHYWGLDLHTNEEAVWTQWGNYSTEMYTMEAEGRIRDHDKEKPLFLYLAYQAVHSANRPQDALQAPQNWISKFQHIQNPQRRTYAAMVAYMDYGIGRVVDALEGKGMLENSVIIFTTDNGGPANGFNFNWANNYPLRGVKASLYEGTKIRLCHSPSFTSGGVRGAGFIHSPLLENPGRVSKDLIHVTDWLPTIVSLAGLQITKNKFDGYDQWDTLQNEKASPREEILLNIDDKIFHNSALIKNGWKIISEGFPWDNWYAPPNFNPESLEDLTVKCNAEIPTTNITNCKSNTKYGYCLFNLKEDPCEINDLSEMYPELLQQLKSRLDYYRTTMVPPRVNETDDPLSDPKLHNGVWEPWINL